MLTGNREFNEIYEKYKNLVLKAAYIYSGDYEASEDITQDTFLKLYIGYDDIVSVTSEDVFHLVDHLFCKDDRLSSRLIINVIQISVMLFRYDQGMSF